MSICDKCKKSPLTYAEINEVLDDKGREKVLCDKCYMELRGLNWRQQYE